MLTFFDYLRERARDSVLAGVHDALSAMDRDSVPSEFRGLSDQQAAASPTESSDSLPAPRRRGRPPKKREAS